MQLLRFFLTRKHPIRGTNRQTDWLGKPLNLANPSQNTKAASRCSVPNEKSVTGYNFPKSLFFCHHWFQQHGLESNSAKIIGPVGLPGADSKRGRRRFGRELIQDGQSKGKSRRSTKIESLPDGKRNVQVSFSVFNLGRRSRTFTVKCQRSPLASWLRRELQ